MKTLITTFVLILFAGTTNAQDYDTRDSNSYPFGYRSPYQGGFNGYGTYYGRGNNQLNKVPKFAPHGFPSRQYPSYQRQLNPYYNPNYNGSYLPYPYYYPE